MCRRFRRTVFYARSDAGVLVIQPGCHNWACPDCAKKMVKQWRVRIALGVEGYYKIGLSGWSFITITAMGYDENMVDCLRSFHTKWPKLSTRFRRKWENPRYVTIPELHRDENGEHTGLSRVHWHMIASVPFIPPPENKTESETTRWFKNNAAQCGLGYVADVEPCDSAAAAGMYATKYMTKMIEESRWPRGYRRIRTSQKWPELDDQPDALDWRRWGEIDETEIDRAVKAIEMLTGDKARLVASQ